ncbi:MAG: DUF1848 domain-containing protein [Candidatus Gallimonas sp.]
MIVNVGWRTDIVNHYTRWFLNRLKEGFVYTRNPVFPNVVTRYELTPDKVDAIVFCSKNYAPILPYMKEICARFRVYCFYTVTAYGADLEPNIPPDEESVKTLKALSAIVGKERLVWRYDPVLLTERYTVEGHFERFAALADAIGGSVSRCVIGFVEAYHKLWRTMPELTPLSEAEKRTLAKGFGALAAERRLRVQSCGEYGDFGEYGIEKRGCITLKDVGDANGCVFRSVRHTGNRQGCLCVSCRDVGAYDSCPNGCRYCYANTDPQLTARNIALHDENSPLLIGTVGKNDRLQQGVQESWLSATVQTSLFD